MCMCPYVFEPGDAEENTVLQNDANIVKMVEEQYETALKETLMIFCETRAKLVKASARENVLHEG